jgi:DNA-binding NarL/FixJ family response regulator
MPAVPVVPTIGPMTTSTMTAPAPTSRLYTLSPRELELLRLVADGLTNEAIGRRLYLSERTVERHLSNAYTKLGFAGRTGRAAAAAAVARG